MQQLEALTREARALAIGELPLTPTFTPHEAEVGRQMQICNACRYCEGFCAVFPAMTRRLEFGQADIHYLANLCHNCGACLHACQYAPPHEFAINIPKAESSCSCSCALKLLSASGRFSTRVRTASCCSTRTSDGGMKVSVACLPSLCGRSNIIYRMVGKC